MMSIDELCKLMDRANDARHETFRVTIFGDGTGWLNGEKGREMDFDNLKQLEEMLQDYTTHKSRNALDEQIVLQEALLTELKRRRDTV